jgi:hypothetical protein
MRLSIKKHNQKYLHELSKEVEIEDLTELLNYLLVNIRGLGWTYKDKKPVPALPQQLQQTSIGYAFDPATFEPAFPTPDVDRNHSQDLIIARMASLIEEF